MKYFLHKSDAFEDEKITELFMEHGYTGLGMFYTMLEKFAKQEKPIKTTILKMQLHINNSKLEKIWKYIEDIGLISTRNGESFNENILQTAKKYQGDNEKNRDKVANWRANKKSNLDVTEPVTSYTSSTLPDGNDPKEKKVKVNKVKVNTPDASGELKEQTVFTKCKSVYEILFLSKNGTEYYFQAIDGKKLKSIISKIDFTIRKQQEAKNGGLPVENVADNIIVDAFTYFVTGSYDTDQWIADNFSLSNLDSKYNDLIAKLKNNKQNGNRNNSTTGRNVAQASNGLSSGQRASNLYREDN